MSVAVPAFADQRAAADLFEGRDPFIRDFLQAGGIRHEIADRLAHDNRAFLLRHAVDVRAADIERHDPFRAGRTDRLPDDRKRVRRIGVRGDLAVDLRADRGKAKDQTEDDTVKKHGEPSFPFTVP